MKKKLTALLLVLVMAFTNASPAISFAADNYGTDITVSLEASAESITPSGSVTVSINVDKTDEMVCDGIQVEVKYDTDVFNKPTASVGAIINSESSKAVNNKGDGSFQVAVMCGTDDNGDLVPAIKSSGVLYKLTFTLKDGAKAGSTSFAVGNTHYSYNNTDYVPVTLTGTAVTVVIPTTGITVSGESSIEGIGNTIQLSVAAQPSNAVQPNSDMSDVTWSSDSTSVATVSNGLVTAVGEGTANITAEFGGFSNTHAVTVSKENISGSVSYSADGGMVYGAKLSASYTGSLEGVTFTWYRVVDGKNVEIATGSEYTLAAEDIGYKIAVKATAENYGGELTCSSDNAVEKASNSNIPAIPEIMRDGDKVVVTSYDADAGLEYLFIDNETEGEWKNEGSISASVGHTYQVKVRYAATATMKASDDISSHELYIPYTPKLTVNVGGVGCSVNDVPSSVTEGDEVTLTAVPSNDYRFVEWTGADDLDVDKTSVTITFTVGQEDISLVAVMSRKNNLSVSITDIDLTYNGTAQGPNFTPIAVEGMGVSVKYYYRNGNVAIDKPTDAGEYEIEITYTSSATSEYASCTARGRFEIKKADQSEPAVPTVSNITTDSFDVAYVDGQQYALSTSSATPDESVWQDTLVTTDLKPGTTYYVYTRKAADKNHDSSAAASTTVTTKHTYNFEIVEGAEVVKIVRVGGTLPETVSFSIKNTGSGTLKIESLELDDLYPNENFELINSTSASATIASGDTYTVSYRVKNMSSADAKTYEDTVNITLVAAEDTDNVVGTASVKLVVKIVEKEEATIEGIEDVTYTYNGQDQKLDLSGATVKAGDKVLDASKLTVKYYDSTGISEQTSTKDALTYTAVVTYEDSDYVGTKTVKMTVEQKELTIVGITAKDKVYDGTKNATVDYKNIALEGVVEGDDVEIDFDTSLAADAWMFTNSDAGDGTVYNPSAFYLKETADRGNYNLINGGSGAITLDAEILQRTVTVTATVADKVYNGKYNDANVSLTSNGSLPGDNLFFRNVSGDYEHINAGDAVKVTVYYVVDGTDKGNYKFVAPKNVTGKVSKKELTVTLNAPVDGVTYNGEEKTVTVTESGRIENDKDVELYRLWYNDEDINPSEVGTYTVKAQLTDEGNKNYTLVSAPAELKINQLELTTSVSELNYSVSYAYTGEHCFDMSELTITQDEVYGNWHVVSHDGDELLYSCYVSDDGLVVNVKENLKASDIDKTITVKLKFSPSSPNYTEAECTAKVTIADDTYINTITPALPSKIKLGDDLDVSESYLVTEFGSGAPKQEINLTDDTRVAVVCEYNSIGTGEDALGAKKIVVTDRNNGKITYTHTITVIDVLRGDKLEEDGTVTLALGTKELPLENIKAVYASGAKKVLSKSDVTIKFADGMNEQRVLNTIGSHKVTVTYTETYFDGTSAAQSCELTVVITAETAAIGGASGNGFEVEPVPDGDEDISYTNPDGSVDKSDVSAKLDELEDGTSKDAIKAEEDKNDAFDAVGDNKVYEKIDFTDKDGNDVSIKDGSMQVTVPYPSDSDKNDDFVIIIKDKDGNIEAIVPVKGENGLQFTIKGDVELVIGWYTPVKDDDEPEVDPEDSFWNQVYWTLIRSAKDSVITANAGYYDKVPQGVLRAVNLSGNTLIINSAYGIQLVITPNSLANINGYRMYYPISYLNEVLKGTTIGGNVISGSTGVTVGVLMPTTGDDTVVTHPYTMTPATEGYFAADAAVKNSVIADAANVDSISVLDEMQHNDGEIIGGAMLIGLGLLSLLGAAYVTMKKRES